MRTLAIDPGYGRCGMAVLEKIGGREILIMSQCIETPSSLSFPERLSVVVRACEALLDEHAPDSMSLERLFITKNQKTAMHVAEVRGGLIAASAARGIPVFEYTPGQVKSAAAGWGGADKQQVAKLLTALLGITKPIRHDDEFDAIAVGVTHLAHSRN